MNSIKFYIISEKYIEYLSKFDNHVSWNKNQKRPYIGVVLEIKNILYFAPLYSYIPFYIDISCDFKLLEEKCIEYENI